MADDGRLTAPDELVREAKQRARDQRGRIEHYERAAKAYFDDQEGMGGADVQVSHADGRPSYRVVGAMRDEMRSRQGSPNMLAPIVDDFVGLYGQMPSSSVVEENDKPEATEVAAKRTRILRGQHDLSRMDMQQQEAAWNLVCLGDTLYTLDPRFPDDDDPDPFAAPGVYSTVVDPRYVYPSMRVGIDRYELDDVYVCSEIRGKTAERQYGIKPSADTVEQVSYYSREEKQVIVDGKRVSAVYHDLGFVPAQWVRFKQVGGRDGQSAISGVIDLHDEMKVMYQVFADSLLFATFPTAVIVNPLKVAGDHVPFGPGAQIEVDQGGDVKLLSPGADPQAASFIFNTTLENLMKQAGTSPIRIEQNVQGSNISGRAIHSAQGAVETRLQLGQVNLGYHLGRLNSKILLMLSRLPGFDKPMDLYRWEKGGVVSSEQFTGDDIGGWWRNRVKFDAALASTRHERVVIALQLRGEKLVPGRYVLEQAGEDDPDRLLREAHDEMAAQMPPPGGPGGPPPGPGGNQGDPAGQQAQIAGPADQGMALAAGGSPSSGPPPAGLSAPAGPPGQPPSAAPGGGLPAFPPLEAAPTMRGMGPAPHVPDVIHEVQVALAGMRLYGQAVALAPRPGVLRVEVTDHRDVRAIKDTLAPLARTLLGPQGRVDVKIVPGVPATNGTQR